MCPGVPGYSVVGVRLATSDSTLQAQDMYFYKVSPGVPRSMHGIALLDKTQHTVPALGGFLLQGGTSVVEHGMGGAGCFRGWHGAEWDRNNYWLAVCLLRVHYSQPALPVRNLVGDTITVVGNHH